MMARLRTTWSGTRRLPRTISFWCRKSSNRSQRFRAKWVPVRVKKTRQTKRVFETGNPMCLLCDDERAYLAYMNYLDAMERQGKVADPDKAVDAVLDALEAADKASSKISRDDPANDKTLSPFFCS